MDNNQLIIKLIINIIIKCRNVDNKKKMEKLRKKRPKMGQKWVKIGLKNKNKIKQIG